MRTPPRSPLRIARHGFAITSGRHRQLPDRAHHSRDHFRTPPSTPGSRTSLPRSLPDATVNSRINSRIAHITPAITPGRHRQLPDQLPDRAHHSRDHSRTRNRQLPDQLPDRAHHSRDHSRTPPSTPGSTPGSCTGVLLRSSAAEELRRRASNRSANGADVSPSQRRRGRRPVLTETPHQLPDRPSLTPAMRVLEVCLA
jgi:hypothetical protein